MHQWIVSALVQIMACRLFGTKPLSKPMLGYCHLDPFEQTVGHFVHGDMILKINRRVNRIQFIAFLLMIPLYFDKFVSPKGVVEFLHWWNQSLMTFSWCRFSKKYSIYQSIYLVWNKGTHCVLYHIGHYVLTVILSRIILIRKNKNTKRHTAHTIVSWPNPKWVKVHG